KLLAEIGIILLLFEVGMETDLSRLKSAGAQAFIVAFFGAVFPFGLSFWASTAWFDLSLVEALFVGGTLTATSIGITLRVLKDIGHEKGGIAQVVIGAAVIDDIIGVILLVFIYDFAISKEISFDNTMSVTVMIFVFLLIAPTLAHIMAHIVKRFARESKVPGFIPTILISLILLFAYLSYYFGAPEILGAFVAGIALSRRFFLPFGAHLHDKDGHFEADIKKSMTPIIQLFTPFFFVMVGLSIELKYLDFTSPLFWLMGLVFLFIAVLGKYIGVLFIGSKCAMNRVLIGISMIPRGEVGLIFAEMGRINNILSNEIYSILVFVIIITTVVPPFLLKWLFKYECVE
ncbi:MAG: cation:proton antiporter, partial [Thiovulaceae bacterium]|nr:cation:proton antiporter [Sulfurimonadaceae bacterium]